MKTLVLFLITSTTLWAQPNFNAVISAIKSGNVATIASHMDANVEMTVGGQDGTYPKAQAQGIIQGFFESNQPSNCSLVHSGAARDGASYYCIGSLTAGRGKYRVYIFFKKVGAGYKIQEMRFEEE